MRQVPDAFVQTLHDGEAALGEVEHEAEPNLGEVWRARAEREAQAVELTPEEAELLREAAESPTVRRNRQRSGEATPPTPGDEVEPDGDGA